MLKEKKGQIKEPASGHYSDTMLFRVIALAVTLLCYALFFLLPYSTGFDSRGIYLITAFLSIGLSVIKKRRWWRGWLIIFWGCWLLGSFAEGSLISMIISLYIYLFLMLVYLIIAIFSPSGDDPVYQQRKQERQHRMR